MKSISSILLEKIPENRCINILSLLRHHTYFEYFDTLNEMYQIFSFYWYDFIPIRQVFFELSVFSSACESAAKLTPVLFW